jgi:hypothetical protein
MTNNIHYILHQQMIASSRSSLCSSSTVIFSRAFAILLLLFFCLFFRTLYYNSIGLYQWDILYRWGLLRIIFVILENNTFHISFYYYFFAFYHSCRFFSISMLLSLFISFFSFLQGFISLIYNGFLQTGHLPSFITHRLIQSLSKICRHEV